MIRFWEIIPGALAWLTLLGLTFLSWRAPVAVVIFILLYDLYWLLKLIYLFFHLRLSFTKMKANLKIDWLARLKKDNPENWEKNSPSRDIAGLPGKLRNNKTGVLESRGIQLSEKETFRRSRY